MTLDNMRFGSLFTGIGGMDLGLERVGMSCVFQSEIDPFCRAVLAKHWALVPNVGDIRDAMPTTCAPVDVLAGGFPCQPHSLAGERKGSGDERDLWPEFWRFIRDLAPTWVVGENVAGLLTSEKGAFFGRILIDLVDLGYTVRWTSLKAKDVGAPHGRERVFILAHRGAMPDLDRTARGLRDLAPVGTTWWHATPEPVAGLPERSVNHVARVKALGNVVVPQVASYVGHLIMHSHGTADTPTGEAIATAGRSGEWTLSAAVQKDGWPKHGVAVPVRNGPWMARMYPAASLAPTIYRPAPYQLPTVRTVMYKCRIYRRAKYRGNLEEAIALRWPELDGLQFNPHWLEWFQGLPPTWTDLPTVV